MENEQRFDIRTLDRNFEKGLITKKEYLQYLKSLDDMEANAVEITAKFGVDLDDEAAAEEE